MTTVLYMKKREFDMGQIHRALLLASAMIGIALLAVFELVPEWMGQYGPIALLALFPGAWLDRDRTCKLTRGKRS